MGMLLKSTAGFEVAPGIAQALGMRGFIANLVPVTIGNIIGGSVMAGLIYWFVYLRHLLKIRNPADEDAE